MKKTTKKILLIILSVAPILVAGWYAWSCYGYLVKAIRPLGIEYIPASIESPIEYGFSARGLAPGVIQSAENYRDFPASRIGLGVVRISEDPDRKYILAIYDDGKFHKLDIQTGKVAAVYDFLVASQVATFFNNNGSFLITAGEIVWNTDDGKMLYCERPGEGCPNATTIAENPGGIYIDPVRPIEITYGRGVSWFSFSKAFRNLQGSTNGGLACYDLVMDSPFDEGYASYSTRIIDRIAIDPSGKYVACILESGAVIVRDWSLSFDEFVDDKGINRTREYPYTRLVRYTLPNRDAHAKDMTFDPTRTWLATLTDRELLIWDLRRLFFACKLNIPVDDGNAISFDRAGKLLALGTKRGMVIYDVEQGKQIAEFNVGDVTALYFTRDNRLLIWGDAEGTVHLWGVR